MIVWICGTFRFEIEANCFIAWELNGIFSQRHIAVRRCRTAQDFVAPITLDEDLPIHTTEMEGCEFPYADCRCKDGKRSTHCKWHGSCTCCHGAGPCPTHDEPERFEERIHG